MDILPIVLFAVAALGGLFLALRHFRNQTLPMPVTFVHGIMAAAGLVTLVILYLRGAAPGALELALALLVVAALGGFALFSFHLRGRRAPSPLVVVHALMAVAGFLSLVVAVF